MIQISGETEPSFRYAPETGERLERARGGGGKAPPRGSMYGKADRKFKENITGSKSFYQEI